MTNDTPPTRDESTASSDDASDRTTPNDFVDDPDVDVEERTRSFEREKFEALRERYDAIDGVVMVGVTADEELLVLGDENSVPPGGDVEPGEDWLDAAGRNIRELTDEEVSVDGPRLVERTEWCVEDDVESFETTSLHVEASLVDESSAFRANPTTAADLPHKYYDPEDPPSLRWIDADEDDVHENHADHVAVYFD